MAFLLSSFGLPGQIVGGLLSSHGAGHTGGGVKHLSQPWASSFGAVLNGKLDALGAGDPVTQLTNAVQSGTPISAITDRLAGHVADAVQRQLPAAQLGSGASRTQLVDSIKAALSPPGNAPPGATATQEVATLARRLHNWLGGVAREADQRAGQQSDTSGQVLDAKRARELPAPHENPEANTSNQVNTSALARSLLASVASSLGVQPGSATGSALQIATASASSPDSARANAASTSAIARDVVSQSSLQARLQASSVAQPGKETPLDAQRGPAHGQVQPAPSAQAPAPATQALLQPKAAPQNVPAPSNAPTGSPAPADLVARMLMRASGVDARVNPNGVAPAENAPAAAQTAAAPLVARPMDGGGTTLPSAMANRMTALLTQAVGAAAASANGGTGGNASTNGNAPGHDAFANLANAFAAAPNSPAHAPAAADAAIPTFAVPATPGTAASPNATSTQQAAASANPMLADPSALVEQVVKGMAMRTQANGTSEVRLRLSPESLGSINMKLSVDGTNVSATAVAQNSEVRNALLSHQHQLARSLAESGLKLTSFTVDLSGQNANPDRGLHDRSGGFGRHYHVIETGNVHGTESESTNGGPALLPGHTLALLNYLA